MGLEFPRMGLKLTRCQHQRCLTLQSVHLLSPDAAARLPQLQKNECLIRRRSDDPTLAYLLACCGILLAASQSPQTTDMAGSRANVSNELMPYVGKYVRASGIVFERTGTHAIVITEIKEMKDVTVKDEE